MAAKKDFTAKNLHEYVDSYLKSYYEVEDKDAAADANMETQDVKTGDASKKEETDDGAFKDRKKLMEFIYANMDSLKSKDGVKNLIEYIKQVIADAKDGEE